MPVVEENAVKAGTRLYAYPVVRRESTLGYSRLQWQSALRLEFAQMAESFIDEAENLGWWKQC